MNDIVWIVLYLVIMFITIGVMYDKTTIGYDAFENYHIFASILSGILFPITLICSFLYYVLHLPIYFVNRMNKRRTK
jgi:hypothetical protein